MSLKTWINEFYPTEADSTEALKNPIKHSIRKWTGLLKKNLKKHHLYYTEGKIYQDAENAMNIIGWATCACCTSSIDDYGYNCHICIINQTLGNDCFEAYIRSVLKHRKEFNPMIMIRFLKKVLKTYQKIQKTKGAGEKTNPKNTK